MSFLRRLPTGGTLRTTPALEFKRMVAQANGDLTTRLALCKAGVAILERRAAEVSR